MLRRREVSSHGSARADPAVQFELGARIAELEAQLTASGACRADALQVALTAARSQNLELLDGQDSLTSQIAGLDLQIDQLRGTIENQQAQLDAAMSGAEGMTAEIADLQAAQAFQQRQVESRLSAAREDATSAAPPLAVVEVELPAAQGRSEAAIWEARDPVLLVGI